MIFRRNGEQTLDLCSDPEMEVDGETETIFWEFSGNNEDFPGEMAKNPRSQKMERSDPEMEVDGEIQEIFGRNGEPTLDLRVDVLDISGESARDSYKEAKGEIGRLKLFPSFCVMAVGCRWIKRLDGWDGRVRKNREGRSGFKNPDRQ